MVGDIYRLAKRRSELVNVHFSFLSIYRKTFGTENVDVRFTLFSYSEVKVNS